MNAHLEPAGTDGRSPLLRALAARPYRWFWLVSAVSMFGDQLSIIALPWLVLKLTGDAAAMGFVIALAAVPRALFMLIGGVVTDRLSPRRVLVVTNLLRLHQHGARRSRHLARQRESRPDLSARAGVRTGRRFRLAGAERDAAAAPSARGSGRRQCAAAGNGATESRGGAGTCRSADRAGSRRRDAATDQGSTGPRPRVRAEYVVFSIRNGRARDAPRAVPSSGGTATERAALDDHGLAARLEGRAAAATSSCCWHCSAWCFAVRSLSAYPRWRIAT